MDRGNKGILILRYIAYLLALFVVVLLLVPNIDMDVSYSQVIYDRDGNLLGAHVAEDEQWRFPPSDLDVDIISQALLTYEDKNFHRHHGLDFKAVGRALRDNVNAGSIKSGASTITMQLARLSCGLTKRTYRQKILEILMAIKHEFRFSKHEILNQYLAHAPYGGNVVGIEAACWRYFGKSPQLLTTAEACMLAVLPNAPSLIHLGKNREALKAKRDFLLAQLLEEGHITPETYELSLMESLPLKPVALPTLAPHLLAYAHKDGVNHTTLDGDIQKTCLNTAKYFGNIYSQEDIQNMAILVLDTYSGEVLAYVGNSPVTREEHHVDNIHAKRSYGSLLKPVLYALSLDAGQLYPQQLLKDTPANYNGYRPENYSRAYDGAVPASLALSKSLNVPFVHMLKTYGIERFISKLSAMEINSINQDANYYGLSLILGGGEASLWEMTGMYASMGRTLSHFESNSSQYLNKEFSSPRITINADKEVTQKQNPQHLSAGAIYHTFKAMNEVIRPNADMQWQRFNSSAPIAWKTGTSFGHKDAWAIGVSTRYTIGIWVGNSDGEGKHNLVGVKKAAPLLFDVYNNLQSHKTFNVPYDDLHERAVCSQSGHLAGPHCEVVDTLYMPASKYHKLCPYHLTLHTNQDGQRVHSDCLLPSEMVHNSWFVLPPDMAMYYKLQNPSYKAIPAYAETCGTSLDAELMSFIYPHSFTSIYLPVNGEQQREKTIFQLAHQKPDAKVHWHLDGQYLGVTEELHSFPIDAAVGPHIVKVVDGEGNSKTQTFEIVGESRP